MKRREGEEPRSERELESAHGLNQRVLLGREERMICSLLRLSSGGLTWSSGLPRDFFTLHDVVAFRHNVFVH